MLGYSRKSLVLDNFWDIFGRNALTGKYLNNNCYSKTLPATLLQIIWETIRNSQVISETHRFLRFCRYLFWKGIVEKIFGQEVLIRSWLSPIYFEKTFIINWSIVLKYHKSWQFLWYLSGEGINWEILKEEILMRTLPTILLPPKRRKEPTKVLFAFYWPSFAHLGFFRLFGILKMIAHLTFWYFLLSFFFSPVRLLWSSLPLCVLFMAHLFFYCLFFLSL